jgi:hypothetical protein
MSLNSRLFNLFASEPSSHLVPVSQELDGSKHGADREDGTDTSVARRVKRMRTMEEAETDEELELKRPPYLHVSHPGLILILFFDMLTSLTVDACWRRRGHKR